MDGDGQHEPKEIPLLLEPVSRGEVDLVIGSRYLGRAKILFYRRLGLFILNRVIKLVGVKVTDSQSDYRALNRKAVEESLKISSEGYYIESEILYRFTEGFGDKGGSCKREV